MRALLTCLVVAATSGCLSAGQADHRADQTLDAVEPECSHRGALLQPFVATWHWADTLEQEVYLREGDLYIDLRDRLLVRMVVVFSWDTQVSERLRATLGHVENNVVWPAWIEASPPITIELDNETWNGRGRYAPDVRAPSDPPVAVAGATQVRWTAEVCSVPAEEPFEPPVNVSVPRR